MITTWVSALLAFVTLIRPSSRFLIEPSGIRMAFTERQYEVSLLWTSPFPLWQAAVLVRQLKCGEDSEETDWAEVYPSQQWNYIQTSAQWEVVYRVVLKEIYPECEYEYSVGAGLVWTPATRFRAWTPYYEDTPTTSDLEHVAKLIVIGDLGIGSSGDRTRTALGKLLNNNREDAIIHLGDIAYDLESLVPSCSRAYFQTMQPLTSLIPYMVLPGNHEKFINYTQYIANFRMPVTPDNEGSNYFYSFNSGRGHFIALSDEHIYDSSDWEQAKHIAWLRKDLQIANSHRDKTPWVVVMAHRPLYCNVDYSIDEQATQSNKDCTFRAAYLKGLIEDIFIEEKVDLFLQAHVHNYQRLSPILHNESISGPHDEPHMIRNAKAPVYILEGAAGNEEGQDWLSPTPQLWTVVQRREIGFGLLRVMNASHLYWEHRDSDTGAVQDYLWLEKF